MRTAFSKWTRWVDRTTLAQLAYPGIYTIALSEKDMSGTPFSWCAEIIYVGMTNARGGLKSRLQQFDNTIRGREGHGGGRRVRYKHPDCERLTPRLYVSICPRKCSVESKRPADLRVMGCIAKHEYECFASFAEIFERLPEFNDRTRSPKK